MSSTTSVPVNYSEYTIKVRLRQELRDCAINAIKLRKLVYSLPYEVDEFELLRIV